MLLSEYIAKLQAILAAHGDLPVVQEMRDEMTDDTAPDPSVLNGKVWVS